MSMDTALSFVDCVGLIDGTLKLSNPIINPLRLVFYMRTPAASVSLWLTSISVALRASLGEVKYCPSQSHSVGVVFPIHAGSKPSRRR